jgi:predicted aldo/keto reductase-like oxidoreductase
MQQIKKKENDMKKLGFGLMRLPLTDASDPASIDVEQVKKMVDIFIEKGFTYFDTAWMYCGFQSERGKEGFGGALSQRRVHAGDQASLGIF